MNQINIFAGAAPDTSETPVGAEASVRPRKVLAPEEAHQPTTESEGVSGAANFGKRESINQQFKYIVQEIFFIIKNHAFEPCMVFWGFLASETWYKDKFGVPRITYDKYS